jgi:di/tricarboxylate transporter
LAGVIFVTFCWYIVDHAPSTEIAWVTGLLIFTIYLFVFEIVNVDEAAITIMVLLGVSSLLAPSMGLEQGLVDTQHLFDGFASNAVISIIAVMIIGAGLDKTGMMSKVAAFILKVGGNSEGRIIPIVSGTVGIISSFMQNVGAAALFLPVVSRISARSGLPRHRDYGGIITINPAQRFNAGFEYCPASGPAHAALGPVLGYSDRPGTGDNRCSLLRPRR